MEERKVKRWTLVKWIVNDICCRTSFRYIVRMISTIIFARMFGSVAYIIFSPQEFTKEEISDFKEITNEIFFEGVYNNSSSIDDILDKYEDKNYEIIVSSGSEVIISSGTDGQKRNFITDFSLGIPDYTEEYEHRTFIQLIVIFSIIGAVIGYGMTYLIPFVRTKFKGYISYMKENVLTSEKSEEKVKKLEESGDLDKPES